MQIIRCKCCGGAKKIIGLGMMKIDCKECNGIGSIELNPIEKTDTIENIESEKPKGKPGRKPKNQ